MAALEFEPRTSTRAAGLPRFLIGFPAVFPDACGGSICATKDIFLIPGTLRQLERQAFGLLLGEPCSKQQGDPLPAATGVTLTIPNPEPRSPNWWSCGWIVVALHQALAVSKSSLFPYSILLRSTCPKAASVLGAPASQQAL